MAGSFFVCPVSGYLYFSNYPTDRGSFWQFSSVFQQNEVQEGGEARCWYVAGEDAILEKDSGLNLYLTNLKNAVIQQQMKQFYYIKLLQKQLALNKRTKKYALQG